MADTHDLVLPLATLWWQNMMQQSGQSCWLGPRYMFATTNVPKTCHERCLYYTRKICWQWQWIVTELPNVSVFCLLTKNSSSVYSGCTKHVGPALDLNKPNASSIAAQTLPPWLELCIDALLKAHSRRILDLKVEMLVVTTYLKKYDF